MNLRIPLHSGVSEFADRCDALILDLWGVIHDGLAPYPGVSDCLDRLRDRGIRVLMLSNAPRPSSVVIERLDGMGIGPDRYERIITSGDVTRDALAHRDDPWHAALGKRYLHLGPERDTGLIAGLDFAPAGTPDDADFILNTGLRDDETEGLEDYREILVTARSRSLPMVCANPDLTVMRGPRTVLCAGALAAAYEEIGGDVRYHGKPYTSVYDYCFSVLEGVPRGRVMMVGDSLRTDIAGANAAGIEGIFVNGGLHSIEGSGSGESPMALLERMADESGHRPSGALALFAW
jgi:HAD superfamily hydrolase (TIGR01459 family)